jgi:hypothetical protein
MVTPFGKRGDLLNEGVGAGAARRLRRKGTRTRQANEVAYQPNLRSISRFWISTKSATKTVPEFSPQSR